MIFNKTKNNPHIISYQLHCKCLQGITGTLRGNQSAGISKFMGIACIPAIHVILKSPHSEFVLSGDPCI